MASQGVQARRTRTVAPELSKRAERAHRILDAATALILRWGYKKTSVDDIARQAGVAKGTIYLHWKTREDLFVTLLLREAIAAWRTILEFVERDPAGIYLSNLTKHALSIIMSRPLTRALYIQDISMLGELLQRNHGDLRMISQQKFLINQELFALYREHGMLRTDLSITEQINMCSALVIGFMSVNQYMPVEMQVSLEENVELLAIALHRTLEPVEPVEPEVLQEMKHIMGQLIEPLMRLLDERLHEALT